MHYLGGPFKSEKRSSEVIHGLSKLPTAAQWPQTLSQLAAHPQGADNLEPDIGTTGGTSDGDEQSDDMAVRERDEDRGSRPLSSSA